MEPSIIGENLHLHRYDHRFFLNFLECERSEFVNYDISLLMDLREDLALLLEDLWHYMQKLY